ncbi:MAG TPA: glycosyltransferase family 87 protein [Planctomycetota bacterium]|nr:glycosyltransferase family 87 protein [Planctomycetota bacterium]
MLALALVLTLVSTVQAVHRARAGRSALVKWRPDVERLWDGGALYGADRGDGREGFPTPPLVAVALTPFLALGDVPGAIVWALFKLALAWWSVLAVLGLCAGRARDFPPWAAGLVLLLVWRVMHSDVTHGNVNLAVLALLVAAARPWHAGNELRSGLWIGLAGAVKVTPLLFGLYFARKRAWAALGGVALGLALGLLVVPGLVLGVGRNLELLGDWWRQMAQPYLSGAPVGVMQSEHINQSLLGVLARLLSPTVAIPAHPPRYPSDVFVNVLALSPEALRLAHRAACALVLASMLVWTRAPRHEREGPRVVGEWALVTLAMLLLSERSWKQHYVVLLFPLAYLAWNAWSERDTRRAAWAGLAAALAVALSGSGVLGARGSDLAESYGLFLWGAVALFVCCGRLLGRRPELTAPA